MLEPVPIVPAPAPAAGAEVRPRLAARSTCAFAVAVLACGATAAQVAPWRALPVTGIWVGEAGPTAEVWARGEDYKLGVAPSGVTFYPRLGNAASRHWPLRLVLTGASCGGAPLPCTAPEVTQTGPRQVRIAHGALVEVWDLAADHAEQSFVLAHSPGAGDLRLTIACDTELVARRRDDGALAFLNSAGEGVVCRDAVVHDARGRRLALDLGFADGAIVLHVPATFLATAAWPVVVDPVLRTVAIATSPTQLAKPRAAFDPVAGVWLVVCEDQVTATDTDVLTFRLALDGSVLDSVALDLSPANAINPDVAAVAAHGSFLAAWIDQTNGQLRWRHRTGSSATFAAAGNLPIGAQPADAPLALGGSRAGDLSLACFTGVVGAGRGAFSVAIDVANATGTPTPMGGAASSIDRLDAADRTGPGEDWGVVLRTPAGAEFRGVLAGATATLLVSPPVPLSPGGFEPRVCGSGPFHVAWLDGASPAVVHAAQISLFRSHTFVIDFADDLTPLENGPPAAQRSDLTLAGDGCRFAYSYREDHPTTPTATVINTVRVRPPASGQLSRFVLDERRALVARVGPSPSLTAAGATGGPAGAYLLLEVNTAPNATLAAIRYDGRQPGDMFTTVTTQCGAPFAPLIGADGFAVLGGTFEVGLARTVGTPVLLVSASEPVPLPLCAPNPACLLGVRLPAVLSVPATGIVVPVPCDANLLGAQLAFQGIDVLAPGGCPASVFGADFRLTNTVVATVR